MDSQISNEGEYKIINSAIDILCVTCSAPRGMVIDRLTGWLWTEEEAGDIKGRPEPPAKGDRDECIN